MRNTALFCIALLFSILSFSAVSADVSGNIEMWPVAFDLSKTAVWQFNLGQKPYIYLNIPEEEMQGFWTSKVFSDWTIGATLKGEDDQSGLLYRREYWLTLPSTTTFNWSDTSNVGNWTVVADYAHYWWPSGDSFLPGTGSTSFSIVDPNPNTVPEPVSMVLFLLGGATLAGRRILRKK